MGSSNDYAAHANNPENRPAGALHTRLVRPCLLVIYETERPRSSLLAQLAPCRTDLLPAQEVEQDPLAVADWRRYTAILVYTPGSFPHGCGLCRCVRRFTDAPLLLLAPAGAPDESLLVLQESADALLSFDVEPALVAGHLAALLRRCPGSQMNTGSFTPSFTGYRDATIEVDLGRHGVRVDGKPVHLTPTEFQFLALLVRHAGDLLPYDQILHTVWGWKPDANRIVHTFAAQVRAKLGKRAAAYIVNEYGSGYGFVPVK